ncbi:hypothetical protein [Streptosporangium sp. H16]|uniref:hypothetical protein n=1 Tax=Streptosporangium sp. H16 TaxID=3444184 RepID=UPI003F79B133
MGGFGQLVVFLVALSVLASLVLRRRRGTLVERRRLRWMILGMVAALGGSVTTMIFGQGGQAVSWVGVVTAVAALPAVIATVVFRHNLLDIRMAVRGSRLFLVFDLRPTVDELLTELGPGLEEADPVEQLGRLAEAVRAGLETRWAAVTLADGTRVVAGREDGAQQQLIALIAGLELARATGGGPGSLALLREQARQTLADLR